MKKYYSVIRKVKIFAGIDELSFDETLACLNAKIVEYQKGQIIQLAGDKLDCVGIVLKGCIEISRTDLAGNRLIVNKLDYPEMFGEAFMFAGVYKSPVTITSLEESTILKLDFKRIISSSDWKRHHFGIIAANMLGLMAEKNLFLNSRLELVTKKTIRARLSAYLLHVADTVKRMEFDIPFNRDQLSEYLNTDRSALSKNLSRLRKEEILDFNKNHFIIYRPEKLCEMVNNYRDEN